MVFKTGTQHDARSGDTFSAQSLEEVAFVRLYEHLLRGVGSSVGKLEPCRELGDTIAATMSATTGRLTELRTTGICHMIRCP